MLFYIIKGFPLDDYAEGLEGRSVTPSGGLGGLGWTLIPCLTPYIPIFLRKPLPFLHPSPPRISLFRFFPLLFRVPFPMSLILNEPMPHFPWFLLSSRTSLLLEPYLHQQILAIGLPSKSGKWRHTFTLTALSYKTDIYFIHYPLSLNPTTNARIKIKPQFLQWFSCEKIFPRDVRS